MVELDSPIESSSDEESSDDNSGPVPSPRVNRVDDNQNPSTLRAVKRAMEYINSCSDLEVKNALENTNFAAKVKSIKQGQSHCQGEVSNSIDTRSEVLCETLKNGTSYTLHLVRKLSLIKIEVVNQLRVILPVNN